MTDKQREPFDENFFMHRNVIQLRGEITDALANHVVSAMHYLMFCFKEGKVPREKREIDLWIMNSPGGSVSAGFAIYDTMNILDCDVRTTCVGTAASMAAFLLSSGTKGKRIALPNSEILIHQPLGGTQGQASDICIYAEHIRKTKEKLNGILARNTGKPIEQIAVDTDRDNCMSAEEALNYGLIDHIVKGAPKAYGTPASI